MKKSLKAYNTTSSANNTQFVSGLSPALFWDVDPLTIDSHKHISFIVERVLNMGTLDDFKLMLRFYGKAKIIKIIKQLRYMDQRLLHFCLAYFNLQISELRCYTQKQSNQTHWNY